MAEAKEKTVAELKAAYEKLKAECESVAKAVVKRTAEITAALQKQLTKEGLDLAALVAKKRVAWVAYDIARAKQLQATQAEAAGKTAMAQAA